MDVNLHRDWIECFRAGDYGPEKGRWTAADLDRIAADYDPAKHAAPVVLGHPEDDAPAYGWVKKLMRAGESLWAQLTKVAPEFEELVRSGRFLQRSVALYKDFPLTAGPYLRHLGFLGAQPPAVKGLQPLMVFSGCYTRVVEFSDTPPEKRPTQTVGCPRFAPSPGYTLVNVELAEEAALIAEAEKVDYGEALRRARQR